MLCSYRTIAVLLFKIWLRPRETVGRFSGRLVFAADPTLVANLVDVTQQESIIDLAGARLMSSRRIGQLHMRNQLQVLVDRHCKIAFHDLHMVDIVLHEEIIGSDNGDDVNSLLRVAQEKTRYVARIDRL